MQRAAPHRRFLARARARRTRRSGGTSDGSGHWWDLGNLPSGDDPISAVIGIVVAIVLVVLFVVFVGPWLWLLVLFLVELVVWLALGLAGLTAWLVFRRPWSVVVLDESGATVAAHSVHGRRRARDHATLVEQRLAGGFDPATAVVAR